MLTPVVSYTTVREVKGPLIVIEKTRGVSYGEIGEVMGPDGEPRRVQVIEVATDYAVAQVLGGTLGLPARGSTVRFYGKTLKMPVSEQLIGRILDGKGQPRDHMPLPPPEDFRDVNGEPLNPYSREYPEEPIETGISAMTASTPWSEARSCPSSPAPACPTT